MQPIWLRYTISVNFDLETVVGSDEHHASEDDLRDVVTPSFPPPLPDEVLRVLAAHNITISNGHWTSWAEPINRRLADLDGSTEAQS